VTTTNQDVVDALSVLPPQAYDYAPDILCIAEGSEVRLLQNMNIAAGLVTSQSGTVIKLIYNNADVEALVSGEHVKRVLPYCIIISFTGFQGFLDKKTSGRTTTRVFLFSIIGRGCPSKENASMSKCLAYHLGFGQMETECYKIQFLLHLASNITAHHARGQTMANCLVSVDLSLQNPDARLAPEITSLLYVACTRVTNLQNLCEPHPFVRLATHRAQ